MAFTLKLIFHNTNNVFRGSGAMKTAAAKHIIIDYIRFARWRTIVLIAK